MKITYVSTKYVITNAERTKFFVFADKHPRRWSDSIENPVGAAKFNSPKEAQEIIGAGSWGAINEDQLLFVIPVEVAVMVETPAPVFL